MIKTTDSVDGMPIKESELAPEGKYGELIYRNYLLTRHIEKLESANGLLLEFARTLDEYHGGTDAYVSDTLKKAEEMLK